MAKGSRTLSWRSSRGLRALMASAMVCAVTGVVAWTTTGAASAASPTDGFFIVTDVNGANDVPAQSDLTQMGRNDSDPNSYNIFFSWDSTDQWTGSGQTGDACALFDYNSNTKVDAVVCGQVSNPNADITKVQLTHAPFVFRCDDSRNDRCGQPSAQQPYTSSAISAGRLTSPQPVSDNSSLFDKSNLITGTDPFDSSAGNGPGSNYPNDASLQVNIQKSYLNGTGTGQLASKLGAKYPALTGSAVLVNVCSYPSAGNGGNNNPFDCIASPGSGFLVIKKNSQTTAGTWTFAVGPTALMASNEPSSYQLTTAVPQGGGTATVTGGAIPLLVSSTSSVPSGTGATVTETQLPGWSLGSVSCSVTTSSGTSTTGSQNSSTTNPGLTGITIASGATTTCTFNNERNTGSILVKKVDKDSTTTLLTGATFTATPLAGGTAVPLPESTTKPGYYCAAGFPTGNTYTISESVAPTNYDVDPSISNVTVSVTDSCATRIGAATPSADVRADDPHKVGSILIQKYDKDYPVVLLSGATFTATSTGGSSVALPESSTSGYYCADGFLTGASYAIAETVAPTGYNAATGIGSVTVGNATCAARLAAATISPDKPVADSLKLGSVLVRKVDSSANPLAGAGFKITSAGGTDTSLTLVTNQTAYFCADGLAPGNYTLTETQAPSGYTAASSSSITVSGDNSTCASRALSTATDVSNSLTPGTVSLVKKDDAGNALSGVGFTLYNDAAPVGTYEAGTDTLAQAQQLTTGTGALTFTGVDPERNYCVVETQGKSADYGTASPVCFFFAKSTNGSAPAYSLLSDIINPRKHKIVVFVCHQGTKSLTSVDVTIDGVTKTTLATLPSGLDATTLCGLSTGATFGGYDHELKSAAVDIK